MWSTGFKSEGHTASEGAGAGEGIQGVEALGEKEECETNHIIFSESSELIPLPYSCKLGSMLDSWTFALAVRSSSNMFHPSEEQLSGEHIVCWLVQAIPPMARKMHILLINNCTTMPLLRLQRRLLLPVPLLLLLLV